MKKGTTQAKSLRDANQAIEALKQKEAWFGMCSSYQFIEPQRIKLSNPALLARIIRITVDETVEAVTG